MHPGDRHLEATVTSVPKRAQGGGYRRTVRMQRGTRAMFTEEGLRCREETMKGLRRRGRGLTWVPRASRCEVLGPNLSTGKGENS